MLSVWFTPEDIEDESIKETSNKHKTADQKKKKNGHASSTIATGFRSCAFKMWNQSFLLFSYYSVVGLCLLHLLQKDSSLMMVEKSSYLLL
jgi:hypothetical protein